MSALTAKQFAALLAKNEARKHRHEACEQDDYGCITLDVSHYVDDVCAQDIDLLLAHIAALEAAPLAQITTTKRVAVRAIHATITVHQVGARQWSIEITAGGQRVAIALHASSPIEHRISNTTRRSAPTPRLIPRVPIASLRFGDLLVKAVQRATGARNIQHYLGTLSNDDLQRHVNDFLKGA
jgi:hypothetical protein